MSSEILKTDKPLKRTMLTTFKEKGTTKPANSHKRDILPDITTADHTKRTTISRYPRRPQSTIWGTQLPFENPCTKTSISEESDSWDPCKRFLATLPTLVASTVPLREKQCHDEHFKCTAKGASCATDKKNTDEIQEMKSPYHQIMPGKNPRVPFNKNSTLWHRNLSHELPLSHDSDFDSDSSKSTQPVLRPVKRTTQSPTNKPDNFRARENKETITSTINDVPTFRIGMKLPNRHDLPSEIPVSEHEINLRVQRYLANMEQYLAILRGVGVSSEKEQHRLDVLIDLLSTVNEAGSDLHKVRQILLDTMQRNKIDAPFRRCMF